jgi:hypothetical protein
MLFDGGKNVRQVSEWLGHAHPSFTMRVYVHLMDDGLGGADFLDQAVNVAPGGESGGAAVREDQADAV